MRKLIIRENESGQYNLENFGAGFAGLNGLGLFDLVIESRSRHLQMEFPRVTAFDLFTRLDLQGEAYKTDRFLHRELIKVSECEGEIVVEASTGSLYDFFKERGAAGACVIRSPLPLAFYWSGVKEEAA